MKSASSTEKGNKVRASVYRKAADEVLNKGATYFSCEILWRLGGHRVAAEYRDCFANEECPKFLSAVTMTGAAEDIGWDKREFRAMCLHMMAAAVEAGDV